MHCENKFFCFRVLLLIFAPRNNIEKQIMNHEFSSKTETQTQKGAKISSQTDKIILNSDESSRARAQSQ